MDNNPNPDIEHNINVKIALSFIFVPRILMILKGSKMTRNQSLCKTQRPPPFADYEQLTQPYMLR